MTTRAALYTRVSTDEQVEHGYSLGGQTRRLTEHARSEGWTVVDVIEDDGYSGADPFRPGLRRVMELAENGLVDVVVAAKRDRLFRSRYYRLAYERDLQELGVRLLALNDTGHKIGDGVLDDFSEWEREEIASRLHGGIRDMVVKGEVKAGPKPPYGYRFDSTGKMLEVFEPEMEAVRSMFAGASGGESVDAIRTRLADSGLPSPGRSEKGWNKTTIRNILRNDLYAPHTFDEVAALVSDEVAGTLDVGLVYGLWTWNRRKTTKRKEWDEEKGKYVDRYTTEERDRSEMVFVPVPDAGIAREVVQAAREGITGRGWRYKTGEYSVGRRFFELRGVLRCAFCGSTLSPNVATKNHAYYACRSRYNNVRHDCDNHRYYPAEDLERGVLEAMRGFLDKREYFLERFEEHAERERAKLRSLAVAGSAESWTEALRRQERMRDGYIDLAAEGIMPRDELREKLRVLDAELERLRQGRDAAANRQKDAEELEAHLAKTREMIEHASTQWLNSRAKGEDRAAMYRRLRLRVEIDDKENMVLSGVFGVRSVRLSANTH